MNHKLIEELLQNPMYVMSLHGKELFHSNFWGWLFEHDIAYAQIFFPEINEIGKVCREEGHRDLTVWNEGYFARKNYNYRSAYVIENKFKSVPKRDQIEEYEDKLGKSFKAGVITGIVQPAFISECKNWRFLPYSYICDEIVKIAQKKETGFQQQIILEYAKMFRQLSDYISGIIAASHEKWISVIDFVPLQSLRMEDVVKKLKACELADYLKSKLQSLPARVGDYELKFGFDYSHTHPIVNIRYEQEADKSKVSVIGIQIEQTQYRWCVQIDKRISFEEEKALFDRYCDYGLFVPYDGNLMTIKGRTTSLNRPYRTYGGPSSKSRVNYSFIYQYCDIVDPSYEELSKQIEQDMLFVTKLLQN